MDTNFHTCLINSIGKNALSFDFRKRGNNACTYFGCLVVTLGSFSVSVALGISSPIIPDIQDDKQASIPHLDAVQTSLFGVSSNQFYYYLLLWCVQH